jgi:hypothetical protein
MRGDVTTRLTGGLLVGCALAAAGAAVPARALPGATVRPGSPVFWVLVAALVAAGLLVLRRPAARGRAAAVAAVLAAQLAGLGVAGVRDGSAGDEPAVVVALAGGVAIAGAVAACAGVALLWREPDRGWAGLRPRRPGLVVAGVAVAAVLPVAVGVGGGDADLTALARSALTWSLPWGLGLASAGWLGPRTGRAAAGTVAASALLTVGGTVALVLAS